MPPAVAQGVKPSVFACSLCHLPTGDGHPESASLAGLSQPYIERQMAEFKSGGRTGSRATNMITIAKAIGDDDIKAASTYFAARTPAVWTKIVEAAQVPKSFVGAGGMRFATLDGGNEKIGYRIIKLPQEVRPSGDVQRRPDL
jgi:cytochrome c553